MDLQFGDIQETALITLAIRASETARPNARIKDQKFWILSGCEDIPYVQTWKKMLKKRGILTLIWIVGAVIVAGIVVLLF